MPTTSNFGWTTPADTDLVKDGAAAIRTLGNGIDTSLVDLKGGTTGQVLAKASNTDLDFTWTAGGDITEVIAGTGLSGGGTSGSVTLTNTVATAFDSAGDLVYGTGADTFTKLGIGTAGQVLKVNSGATAPEWGSVAATKNYTLLNTGGTALSGAATRTISGISGMDDLFILVDSASSANSGAEMRIRINSDTGSNYYWFGTLDTVDGTYSAASWGAGFESGTSLKAARMASNAGSTMSGGLRISGGNTSGVKMLDAVFGGQPIGGGDTHQRLVSKGYWNNSATITSISIISDSGNWDGGTVYVYASA